MLPQNEKRALTIALGNDLAYVVQAVAPNFVWKTTDFPKATKGLSWVIGLNTLLSKLSSTEDPKVSNLFNPVFWTFFTLYLTKRDERIAARKRDEEQEGSGGNSELSVEKEGLATPKSASIA